MRAFGIMDYGETPQLVDLPEPAPGNGEVLLDVAACGLNFADLLMAEGRYQERPEPPVTLGMEMAGTIAALGPGVARLAPGQRVAVFGGTGGLAERAVVEAARCSPLPDGMPFAEAAAFQVAYGTSHVALTRRARLAEGETLLVLGAAGGVGLTAVELGRRLGARVVAAARGAEKLAVAQAAGAQHLVDTEVDDLRQAVRDLGGADVVYDPVGGPLYAEAMRTCRPEARYLVIGFAAGLPEVRPNHLLVKNVDLIGFYWGGYMTFRPEIVRDSLDTLLGWYAEGGLRPHVSHTLPLERAAEGLDLLRRRASTGKIVVTLR